MNKTSAKEWLRKAWHNLSGAKLLYEVDHYTDVIAVEVHYAAEKAMKSLIAFENKKIPKTHDLIEIHALVKDKISFQEKELDLLDDITAYHIEESYPVYEKNLSSKEEIEEVMQFTEELLQRVCLFLSIDEEEIKK